MKLNDVLENLCSNDLRNPDSLVPDLIKEGYYDDEELPPVAAKDCKCDNCFYGRTPLAETILKLMGKGVNAMIQKGVRKNITMKRRMTPKSRG